MSSVFALPTRECPTGKNSGYFLFRTLALIMLLSNVSLADDWPNWRGRSHDDKSTESGLLQEWPDEGPNRIWHIDTAGLGYAGFAVVNDRIYTLGQEDSVEFALCLDAATGKEIWRAALGDAYENAWGDGPRGTPSIDGKLGYFLTARGDLKCLKIDDGAEVWASSMSQFGGEVPVWGYSESPLIDGDKLICTPGGKQGTLLALNKLTGDTIWLSPPVSQPTDDGKAPEPVKAHYSSVVPADWNNQHQYIQLTVQAIVGVSAEDGSILWQSEWPGRVAVIPSPIFDDGKVYVTSGYGTGSKLIQLDDDAEPEVLWRNRVMKNHHGGVIQLGDYFYGHSDKVGLVCQSQETGELKWNTKKIKKGAISYADNRFYYLQENDGQVYLLALDENGPTVKGKFKLEPQTSRRKPKGKIWTHPVISNGRMFLRDQEMIYCYDVTDTSQKGQ